MLLLAEFGEGMAVGVIAVGGVVVTAVGGLVHAVLCCRKGRPKPKG